MHAVAGRRRPLAMLGSLVAFGNLRPAILRRICLVARSKTRYSSAQIRSGVARTCGQTVPAASSDASGERRVPLQSELSVKDAASDPNRRAGLATVGHTRIWRRSTRVDAKLRSQVEQQSRLRGAVARAGWRWFCVW